MDPKPPISPVTRIALLIGGWIAMLLALAGVLLPLVPATPFLLIALACFVRSSPRLHQRLHENKRLGPYIAQWERDKSIPRAAKRKAYLLTIASFSISFALAPTLTLRVVVAVLGVTIVGVLACLKTTAEPMTERVSSSEKPT